MRWNNLTLRAQVMAIVFISWTIVGVISVGFDIYQFKDSRAEEIMNRGDAYLAEVVSTLARTSPQNRETVAQNFFPSEWSVRIGTSEAAAALKNGFRRPNLAQWLLARLESRGLDIAELSVADTIVHDSEDPNELLVLFKGRVLPSGTIVEEHGKGRYLVSVFSVRLTGETGWMNCYLLMKPKEIWPSVVVGSIDSLSALIMLCLLGFLIQKIMHPLSAIAVNAELIGRGQEVGPLVEVGSIDVRRTIVAFNRMEARIVLALEYKTALLRSLGHDLKGPIARISDAMQTVSPDETKSKLLKRLSSIREIVNSVTSLNRATHHDGEIAKIDLPSLIEALVDEQVEAGRDVTCSIEHSVVVRGRHNAITRVLRNLLENAAKYGGTANVILTISENMAAIHIDDEGPGIPTEQLETAFEPFQRLGAAGPGSGLGLAIVRTIVVDQGGTVSLENRASGGLRASVFLPIDEQI